MSKLLVIAVDAMVPEDQAPKKVPIALSLLTMVLGLYCVLVAIGVIAPDQKQLDQAPPLWFGIAFGSIFLLGGTAAIIQILTGGGKTPTGGVPATAPLWLRLFYGAICIAIVILMAALFTWVAFGPGERHFTGSGANITGDTGGRIAFGIGAALMWVGLAVIGLYKIRHLLSRHRS
ncbi:MAG: hypothetical protein ABSE22_06940 [Xanthobacteraceae bacterium]|jgi:hypothetical protein